MQGFETIDVGGLTAETGELFEKLYPICRSISGEGVRRSLSILQEVVDFDVIEVPTGTACFDWTIPEEWNIRDAYIKDSSGRRIVDFQENNLHVVSYSIPVNSKMPFSQLKKHLHTLPDVPNAIPYRTSYYSKDWGICLTYEHYMEMDVNEEYHVVIDSVLESGSLTLGESLVNGTSGDVFLISTYCCHPSLANDNVSGMVLWALLLREMKSRDLRHSYRFVIHPETIGAIAYLWLNPDQMKSVTGGFAVTTVAGPGKLGYKHTFVGDHLIDRAVYKAFRELDLDFVSYPFDINGSDERQYSSQGFRIPIGTICKDKYYEYEYYHTSMDDLNFISAENLIQTFQCYLRTIEMLEMNLIYRSLCPNCEPQLGKRDLYPKIGGEIKQKAFNLKTSHSERRYKVEGENFVQGDGLDAIGWLMFYCDGRTPLLDISDKAGLSLNALIRAAKVLVEQGLLEPVEEVEGS